VEREIFGTMADGTPIELYHLKSNSIEAECMTYGAGLLSLRLPDRSGRFENVLLRHATLDGYVQNHRSAAPFFFGSTIGRYANRIAAGRFTLNGQHYSLTRNNGPNTLHGGPGGFYNVVWNAEPIENGVLFRYLSRDGEEGFPGRLDVVVRFTLSGADLKMEYEAATDKTTVINLTNHAYFNLAGAGRESILSHHLQLAASRFTPVNTEMIPTGELRPVAATPFDFRTSTPIGERIRMRDEQLIVAQGYDHNFIFDDASGTIKRVAELYDPASGRVLEVLTTEPGVQFYSGNFLDGNVHGPLGEPYAKYGGLCLETQHFPDSPNHPSFPSTVLHPGDRYHSVTIYRFSTR
jgi:aldose 1-epimerase